MQTKTVIPKQRTYSMCIWAAFCACAFPFLKVFSALERSSPHSMCPELVIHSIHACTQVSIQCSGLIGCHTSCHTLSCLGSLQWRNMPQSLRAPRVSNHKLPKSGHAHSAQSADRVRMTWAGNGTARGAKRHRLCCTLGPVPYSTLWLAHETWWKMHMMPPRAVSAGLLIITKADVVFSPCCWVGRHVGTPCAI